MEILADSLTKVEAEVMEVSHRDHVVFAMPSKEENALAVIPADSPMKAKVVDQDTTTVATSVVRLVFAMLSSVANAIVVILAVTATTKTVEMVVEISQPSTVARLHPVEEEAVASAIPSSVVSALAEIRAASRTMPMAVELPALLVHSAEEEVVCVTPSKRANATVVTAAASPTKSRLVVIKWVQLLLLCS